MPALIADLDRETETLLDAAGFYRARETPWDIVAKRLELSERELFALLRRNRTRYQIYADWHCNDLAAEYHHREFARLRRAFREADTTAKKLDAAGRLQAEAMRRDHARVRHQLNYVKLQIRLAREEERAANRALRRYKQLLAEAARRKNRGQRRGGQASAGRHRHQHGPRPDYRDRVAREQVAQRGTGTQRHRPERHHAAAPVVRHRELQRRLSGREVQDQAKAGRGTCQRRVFRTRGLRDGRTGRPTRPPRPTTRNFPRRAAVPNVAVPSAATSAPAPTALTSRLYVCSPRPSSTRVNAGRSVTSGQPNTHNTSVTSTSAPIAGFLRR